MTQRYWVAYNTIIREWTQEEYNTLNPTDRIEEDVLYNICMCCGRPKSIATRVMLDISGGTIDNDFLNYCSKCVLKKIKLKRNNGYKKIRTELICVEFGEEDFCGKIIQYTRFYGEEN